MHACVHVWSSRGHLPPCRVKVKIKAKHLLGCISVTCMHVDGFIKGVHHACMRAAGCYSPDAVVVVEGVAAPVKLRDVAVGAKVLCADTSDWIHPTTLKYCTLMSFVSNVLRE